MVFVIAEIGVNHDGDRNTACELIRRAADAGADAVKFQHFDAERLDPPGPRRDMLKGLQLPIKAWPYLKRYAEDFDVEFMATPFDLDALKLLVDLGVKRIKIGSADLGNEPLLKAAADTGLPVILSTGMASLNDIWNALGQGHGLIGWQGGLTLLHCTSAYPAPPHSVNLEAMQTMRINFRVPIGYSDHTQGIHIALAAVALGAEVIEKHLTLDTHLPGPDHKASIAPFEFREMVKGIREIELAIGDGVKAPQFAEEAIMAVRDEREAHRHGVTIICAT